MSTKQCAWCYGPIPRAARRDTLTCSKKCRQAKARFRVGVAPPSSETRRMKFAYADPPYPGLAHYYPENREVNHRILVETLQEYYRDGWALSTSSDALSDVLELCPNDARVAVWIKGARSSRTHAPRKTWEPVIFVGGRTRQLDREGINDSLHFGGRQHSHPNALIGMKPAAFCEWVFQLLGAEQGDELDDIFPGSGAVSRAWDLHMCCSSSK